MSNGTEFNQDAINEDSIIICAQTTYGATFDIIYKEGDKYIEVGRNVRETAGMMLPSTRSGWQQRELTRAQAFEVAAELGDTCNYPGGDWRANWLRLHPDFDTTAPEAERKLIENWRHPAPRRRAPWAELDADDYAGSPLLGGTTAPKFAPEKRGIAFSTRSGGKPKGAELVGAGEVPEKKAYHTVRNGWAYSWSIVVDCVPAGTVIIDGQEWARFERPDGSVFLWRHVRGDAYSFDYGEFRSDL